MNPTPHLSKSNNTKKKDEKTIKVTKFHYLLIFMNEKDFLTAKELMTYEYNYLAAYITSKYNKTLSKVFN